MKVLSFFFIFFLFNLKEFLKRLFCFVLFTRRFNFFLFNIFIVCLAFNYNKTNNRQRCFSWRNICNDKIFANRFCIYFKLRRLLLQLFRIKEMICMCICVSVCLHYFFLQIIIRQYILALLLSNRMNSLLWIARWICHIFPCSTLFLLLLLHAEQNVFSSAIHEAVIKFHYVSFSNK